MCKKIQRTLWRVEATLSAERMKLEVKPVKAIETIKLFVLEERQSTEERHILKEEVGKIQNHSTDSVLSFVLWAERDSSEDRDSVIDRLLLEVESREKKLTLMRARVSQFSELVS